MSYPNSGCLAARPRCLWGCRKHRRSERETQTPVRNVLAVEDTVDRRIFEWLRCDDNVTKVKNSTLRQWAPRHFTNEFSLVIEKFSQNCFPDSNVPPSRWRIPQKAVIRGIISRLITKRQSSINATTWPRYRRHRAAAQVFSFFLCGNRI